MNGRVLLRCVGSQERNGGACDIGVRNSGSRIGMEKRARMVGDAVSGQSVARQTSHGQHGCVRWLRARPGFTCFMTVVVEDEINGNGCRCAIVIEIREVQAGRFRRGFKRSGV